MCQYADTDLEYKGERKHQFCATVARSPWEEKR